MPKVNGVFAPLVNTTIQLPAQSNHQNCKIRFLPPLINLVQEPNNKFFIAIVLSSLYDLEI